MINLQQLPQPSNRLCRFITDEVSEFITYMEMGNSNILKKYLQEMDININVTVKNEHLLAIE